MKYTKPKGHLGNNPDLLLLVTLLFLAVFFHTESVYSVPVQGSAIVAGTRPLTGQGTEDLPASATSRREIMFVDEATQNYQQLVGDLLADRDGSRQIDVVVLDGNRDGIIQMSEALIRYRRHEIDAIHILSHGIDGGVKLGNTWLTSGNLSAYRSRLTAWQGALSPGADLLIYGCGVASSEKGQQFIKSVSMLTGSNVAASVDDTGSRDLGGNWDLEYSVGIVDTANVLDIAGPSQWAGVLGVRISGLVPAPLSNEILVNTTTANDQWNYYWSVRTVAVAANGSFVKVWIDLGGADGNQYGIYGQRFDAGGNKVGGEFLVNTITQGSQDNASIAMAADGRFIVLWDGPATSGSGILGQRFLADGTRVGGEFEVNTYTQGSQKYPEAGYAADGSFVVAWVSPQGGGGAKTVFQRFDANANRVGGEVLLSSTNLSDQILDSLCVKPDGSFLVTWTEAGDVYGRLYDANTLPVGAEFRMNQYVTGTQEYSIARLDAQGNFVAVWESVGQDGSGMGIYGRRFSADGTPLGNEFPLTSNTAGDQIEPQVAVDPSGNFVVTWSDLNARDGSAESVWMRRFDFNGTPLGAEVQVNQTTSGYQAYPVIDMNATGRVVVAWEGNGPGDSYGVFVRLYQIGQFVTEGATTTFTVVLDTAPTAPVTLNFTISDTSEISLNTTSLTFDGTNWNVPQTVTITGLQDWIVDGAVGVTIVTSPLVSTDPAYSGLNPDDIPVVVADSRVGTYSISGAVFEDVNYGGGAGRNKVASSGVGRSGARVELYNSAGSFVTFTTTDASGNYSFTGLASATFTVRVVNSTVTSSRAGYVAGLLPVQTFRTNASSGTALAVTDYVGGQNPSVADAGNGGAGTVMNTTTGVFTAGITGTAQSITTATYAAGSISGVDFGFNFDTIVNTNNSGQGSLGQFITNANTLNGDASLAQSGLVGGKENAVFMISNGTAAGGLRSSNNYFSSGVATISPTSALPSISTTMVINAQKQPGWTSAPIIELNGTNAGAGAVGMQLTASDSTIRGLVINRFLGDGLQINGGDNNLIAGNYIGTNAAGTTAAGNGAKGVYLSAGANGNQIGGTVTNDRNVVAGNTQQGIYVGGSSSLNVVQGNYIGTNAAGNAVIANGTDAIVVDGSANTTIGGAAAGAGNLIGGSGRHGIYLYGSGATGTQILGNAIGTDVTKTRSIPNTVYGIYIDNGAHDNTIGGTTAAAGNLIAWNTQRGVVINSGSAATGNAILGNAIFGNGTIGIDLGSNGVTVNDGAKTANQPNLLMDYPVFTSATISGSTLTVAGYVGSLPGQSVFAGTRVEIFRSDNDASGYGEGQYYLGYLTTDANGNFSGNLTVIGMAPGYKITGTATDGSNNTSEFGPNVTVTTGGGLCPGFTVTTTTDGAAGSLRECITAANATTGATIVVPAGTYTLSIAGQGEDNNATGDLDIRSTMTIAGEGAKVTTINGGGIDRVFHVVGGTVTLTGMRIQNGNAGSGDGSGILNQGTLTLNDVTVNNNFTSGRGGGIYNDTSGTLSLLRSTISGNTAASGGGMYYNGTAAGSLTNVTISGNSSSSGGGIYNNKTLTLTNITVNGNSATISGGGILNSATGSTTLKNTIVSNNTGGNCSGTITSAGYNIDSANTCALAGTGDKPNTNPTLGALADNGGPTMTHALQAGSPAIDAGTATGAPSTDQRGVVRPQGMGYDIGAYEYAVPTAVTLISFTATDNQDDVHLQWQTGHEVDNLGFHVYREEEGQLYRLTPEIIAGSALLAGSGTPLGAGLSYQWWDLLPRETGKVAYWLEDIDLGGKRTLHGPVSIVSSGKSLPGRVRPDFLSGFGMKMDDRYKEEARVRELRKQLGSHPKKDKSLLSSGEMIAKDFLSSHETTAKTPAPAERVARTAAEGTSEEDRTMQKTLASGQAVKIVIDQEGWYRIDQSELAAAGLSPGANPRYLQLYADGKEQPLRIIGTKNGTSLDAVEFYGTGLDIPSTDRKVYWLVAGSKQGTRLDSWKSQGGRPGAVSFPSTVERKDRILYFAALKNGDTENFFGPVTGQAGVDQLLHVPNPSPSAPGDALLEVVLQGVTSVPHRVKVLLNDEEAGELAFEGRSSVTAKVAIPQAALLEGDNLVTLIARNGETDISLIDRMRLTYWHTYQADEDTLKCTAQGGTQLTLNGFSDPDIRVIDITAPDQMYDITGTLQSGETGYSVTFKVPGAGSRTLLALAGGKVSKPLMMKANGPSSWSSPNSGADLVIISHGDFREALQPLVKLRQSQGISVTFVDVEDLYDEFSFGAKDPRAIREFLSLAQKQWRRPPRVVLLVGDASVDPRNYLGFGDHDLVPTKLIDTQYLETASDDWFADFNDDGLTEMALGRLPVRTAEDAAAVAAKIIGYEKASGMNGAVLVADTTEGFDFEAAAREIEGLLPISMPVHEVFRGRFQSDEEAKQEILGSIDQGPSLVTYIGHGSVGLWRGGILSSDDADSLINGARLPFVVSMSCLNGAFHDLYTRGLAEALLTAPRGGAVAVWASSGLTEPEGQLLMNKELMRLLFNGKSLTLGEATMKAKAATTDQDIRKTWILFGDPMTKLKLK